MAIYFDGWKLLIISYHPDKFGGHMHCASRDIRFLIFQVTRRSKVQTVKSFLLKNLRKYTMKSKRLDQTSATYHG